MADTQLTNVFHKTVFEPGVVGAEDLLKIISLVYIDVNNCFGLSSQKH